MEEMYMVHDGDWSLKNETDRIAWDLANAFHYDEHFGY